MKTSVIGYPRIGTLRELKFAEEKYFRGELDENGLKGIAASLRASHWTAQKNAGTDFIPSNDFSYYDGVLDTAELLGCIPARYKDLGISPLGTYFAMARGYQGAEGDVKALAMKKWFNTNYHYIVPEIDDDTVIALSSDKPVSLYLEAKALGIETKPVVTGPFTFLKLAKFTGGRCRDCVSKDAAKAYRALLTELEQAGAEWVQFDEPYLVRDLNEKDIASFKDLYTEILSGKGSLKVLLQTYFGDIRDCYREVCALPFDGIGLDFKEGKKSFELVKKNGFPSDKVLFAGLVNGKNIWKNHYAETVSAVEKLRASTDAEIVLSTSCSLLHVPYTLDNETKLSAECRLYFAFAEEKLAELEDLKEILSGPDPENNIVLTANKELFAKERSGKNADVTAKVAAITDADCTRLPAFAEREKIQKVRFNLPLLPTTTIGSFPQTKDVKANRAAYKKGEITKEEYNAFNRKKIADVVALQEELGLDVLVHGEYERNDMVEYFGECLTGYVFTERAWVQSYGTRCVKPPIIWGDVYREKPMTVEWSVYAQSLTSKPMKGMLTGPVTILNWSFPREDISLRDSVFQIALAIREEVLDLEKNGIRVIQVDEAALREKLPLRKSDWESDYLSWAIPAFRLVHSGVKAETQIHTHMCYSEFTDIIPAIDSMDADVITFEASRSDLQILDSLKANNFRTEVGPGVYDIHSPRVPSQEEIETALKKMLERIEPEKLWVNPDCGLKTRDVPETVASLTNLVAAAKAVRKTLE